MRNRTIQRKCSPIRYSDAGHLLSPSSINSRKYNSLCDFDLSKVRNVYDDDLDDANRKKFQSEIQRFIEISKYFSNPMKKTASYLCENYLVSYPHEFTIEYKRGGVTHRHIYFSNLTLEPVHIRYYKIIPNLKEIKFMNLAFSRCKRIPPGLGFDLGIMYDDVNEKPSRNAKMIFVASRKTTTPCYQICEIQLKISKKCEYK